MKKYICWENDFECYDENEIKEVYRVEVDKSEYDNFDDWLDKMIKTEMLIEEVE